MISSSKRLALFLFIILLAGCNDQEMADGDQDVVSDEISLKDTLYGDLTDQQQYYQHLIIDLPASYQQNIDSLSNWVTMYEPGGLFFSGWNEDSVLRLKRELDTLLTIQPFYYTDYFDYLTEESYPYWEVSEKNRKYKWTEVFCNANYNMIGFREINKWGEKGEEWLGKWKDSSGVILVSHHFEDDNAIKDFDLFRNVLKRSDNTVHLSLTYFDSVGLEKFRIMDEFKGVFWVSCATDAINRQLINGADLVTVSVNDNNFSEVPFDEWIANNTDREIFNISTERILRLKKEIKRGNLYADIDGQLLSTKLNLISNSTSVLNNREKLIPLNEGASVYSISRMTIKKQLRTENKLKFKQSNLDTLHLKKIINKSGTKVILVADTASQDELEYLSKMTEDKNTIVCFSNVSFYEQLKACPNLVYFANSQESTSRSLFIQQLTGQLSIGGSLYTSDSLVQGIDMDKIRLARTVPEFCGLSSDSLRQIDYAAKSAINGRAFPGCQVLIAKDGCIVYNKSFGHHSYDRVKPVTNESIYDLASLTKVVSTTLIGMKLYEMETYQLSDSLKDYLPDSLKDYLPYPSTIRNTTFQELFIHKSGLPAGFPIIDYMQYTSDEVGRFDRYYCDLPDSVYSIEVAENFYLDVEYRDSMWLKLNQIWLDNTKPYKYSDVNMNTLYFMFRHIIDSKPEQFGLENLSDEDQVGVRDLFVEYLYNEFYKPLGMNRTGYKPLQKFDKEEVVPTENERYWRKQLLQGYVHDPNAALYGGIAGNAGIFSTAEDLAVLCEMLLQQGIYNGKRYLTAETVTKFTSAQPESHRGLGFNKPSLFTSAFGCANEASALTYGHTGFTGTCFWVDPESELVYIFLSNRVHPTVNNRIYQYGIRANAHAFAYEANLFKEVN